MLVMRYRYSRDMSDLQKALPLLEESLNEYRKLTELTKNTYLYANSLQSTARKIPFDGKDRKYKRWEECLPEYEKELENFRHNLLKLNSKKADGSFHTMETEKGVLMDWLFE